MELKNQTFSEACVTVGEICGIELEQEPVEYTEEQKKHYAEKQEAIQQQEKVLNYVVPVYQKALFGLPEDHPAKVWLKERLITDEIITEKKIGWGGDDWNTVTTPLINQGLWNAASALGISRRSKNEDTNYDGYRSRIIFPIKDRNGRLIGLGGRYIKVNAKDASEIAKYINPPECDIYSKSTVLYGLSDAEKAIQEKGFAFASEGYMDVINPHRVGILNTVATCGTAFTKEQILLLKRYTNHVALWRDNDAAGEIAFNKNLLDLLKHGLQVSRTEYDEHDPDDYVKSSETDECPAPKLTDAVIFRATQLWEDAKDNIHTLVTAKTLIMEMLACIDNDILRNHYFDNICRSFKWKVGDSKKELDAIVQTTLTEEDNSGDEPIKFASWMTEEQKEEVLMKGYISINRKDKGLPFVGYYSFTQNGKTQLTNFIVKPLFRIEAGQDSRYLSEIYNGYNHAIVDMPAKIYPSIEQFQGMCIAAGGAYIINGSKNHWLRIATDLLLQYPSCTEVLELGWQKRYHFFSFVDKVFFPGKGLEDLNEWGIVEFEGEKYLVSAASEAYKKLQFNGTDPYEHLRWLTYKKSPVNFSTWSNQMFRVYEQKGIVGIAFAILTLFRDVIFDVDNNCPHLYGFGEPSSGKSKWAESITAIFYYKRAAWNLNSGTDFAFFLYMSTFSNCPAHLNEFDIEVIKPEWFQAIKAAYDGEGRVKGKIGVKNSVEIQKFVSTLILTGQKLITADDNSVVTRSIIEAFSTNNERTEEDKQEYNKLKDWERKGMSSLLLEVLEYRKFFEENYKDKLNNQLSTWRKLQAKEKNINQRILQNFAHLATCYTIISDRMVLPQSSEAFTDYCFQQAVKWSGFIQSTDTLSEFWRTVEFFVNQNQILAGWDYVVESVVSLRVRINRTEEHQVNFDGPTKILFLRLNNVHKLFQTAYRSRTGKEAMTLDNLLHYFSSKPYNLGAIKQRQFSRIVSGNETVNNTILSSRKEEKKITSCYAFLYDDLGIDIEVFDGNAPGSETDSPVDSIPVSIPNQEELPF
jgi:DNA primase catalytic core